MKQKEDNKTVNMEDIMLWSDGTWCYRYELYEMQHMSDDYEILEYGSIEYDNFFERKVSD
jgi:hypothetical protein